jgi:hypothetical protein
MLVKAAVDHRNWRSAAAVVWTKRASRYLGGTILSSVGPNVQVLALTARIRTW